MSLVGMAKSFAVSAVSEIANKFAPLAADFSPILALLTSLFGVFIVIAILKKFEKI